MALSEVRRSKGHTPSTHKGRTDIEGPSETIQGQIMGTTLSLAQIKYMIQCSSKKAYGTSNKCVMDDIMGHACIHPI
jgi:hypothetical protein